jgi:hypothetical protein
MELGGALEMMVLSRNSVMGGATQLRKNSVVVASSSACFHGCWIHKSSCVVSFTLFACLLACCCCCCCCCWTMIAAYEPSFHSFLYCAS